MQGFAAELGLTPTGRARMNLPKENEEDRPHGRILARERKGA